MKVKTKQEVIEILSANLANLAKFGVSKVGLFGSFVREEQTENSDVDLLIVLDNPDWNNYCHLLDFTDTLFDGRSTDIVTERSLNEISGRNIFREVEFVNRSFR